MIAEGPGSVAVEVGEPSDSCLVMYDGGDGGSEIVMAYCNSPVRVVSVGSKNAYNMCPLERSAALILDTFDNAAGLIVAR